MPETIEYASFLLRIWRERASNESSGSTGWMAEVESIQSGDSWQFTELAAMFAFLQANLDTDCSTRSNPN